MFPLSYLNTTVQFRMHFSPDNLVNQKFVTLEFKEMTWLAMVTHRSLISARTRNNPPPSGQVLFPWPQAAFITWSHWTHTSWRHGLYSSWVSFLFSPSLLVIEKLRGHVAKFKTPVFNNILGCCVTVPLLAPHFLLFKSCLRALLWQMDYWKASFPFILAGGTILLNTHILWSTLKICMQHLLLTKLKWGI